MNAPQLHHSLFPGSKNEETLQGVREKIRMNTNTNIPSCALVGLKNFKFIRLCFLSIYLKLTEDENLLYSYWTGTITGQSGKSIGLKMFIKLKVVVYMPFTPRR